MVIPEHYRKRRKNMFRFNSDFHYGNNFPNFDEKTVKDEPMLFRCSVSKAYELGGPITKAFLDTVGTWGASGNIDTRVHMLMPGWYPCIPGWHHDDVPRSRSDGQPDYVNPAYHAHHVMGLINGDICPTQFAVGGCKMPEVELGDTVYRVWNDEVEDNIRDRNMHICNARSNRLIYFDDHSFHRGTKAIERGWRWFGRLTIGTDIKPKNEVRRQVQVYMPVPTQGW
jgi:hypothetical protein